LLQIEEITIRVSKEVKSKQARTSLERL